VEGRRAEGVEGRYVEGAEGRWVEGVGGSRLEGVGGRREEGVEGRRAEGVEGKKLEGEAGDITLVSREVIEDAVKLLSSSRAPILTSTSRRSRRTVCMSKSRDSS
jgi:hypothetical protein